MLYVLTGGARSGKSSAAEGLAAELGGAVVVAAAGSAAGDEEMAARIEAHREARPKAWRVREVRDAGAWTPGARPGETVVLECLGTLLGRLMDETAARGALAGPWDAEALPEEFADEVEARMNAVTEACAAAAGSRDRHLVVVTNEVGDGVVPAHASGRLFRDVLGRANRRLVEAADGAWLVVAGRCLDLKSLPAVAAPTAREET